QYRIGLRRVDDRGFAGLFAHGEVAVVVAQQRDLHDAHGLDIANSGENRNRGTKSRIDTAPVDRIASTLRMEDFAMDITKKVAEFVAGARYEAMPPKALENAKAAALDCLGVALAGSRDECAGIAGRIARQERAAEETAVWGQGFRSSALAAAFVNGV